MASYTTIYDRSRTDILVFRIYVRFKRFEYICREVDVLFFVIFVLEDEKLNIMSKHKSTITRALHVYRIVQKYYEEGRHDRSMTWIYRNKICRYYDISERTFRRYVALARKHQQTKLD